MKHALKALWPMTSADAPIPINNSIMNEVSFVKVRLSEVDQTRTILFDYIDCLWKPYPAILVSEACLEIPMAEWVNAYSEVRLRQVGN